MSLFAGELQVVAGTGPAVASAKVRGADASMIMGFEVFLPYYLIATPAIKNIEDLKGKVGANHSAATSADFAMRLGLRNIGPDPERDVNLRVVGATNLRMIMMQQGQAQFSVFSTTEREEAEKMGFKVLVDLAGKRIPYAHSGVITSQKMLREKRDAMKTILAEMARTRPEVLKHDAGTMVDRSIVKAIEDEGFLQKLKSN